MADIIFEDASGRPLADAVVAVSRSPAGVRDIGLIADERGCIQLSVEQPGTYEFSVFHAGRGKLVSTSLECGDHEVTLVVPG